jgi:hypothetical protein
MIQPESKETYERSGYTGQIHISIQACSNIKEMVLPDITQLLEHYKNCGVDITHYRKS